VRVVRLERKMKEIGRTEMGMWGWTVSTISILSLWVRKSLLASM
jgi:hypothetical protein